MARILIADDDAGVRHMLADSLASEGHEVALAADGAQALAAVKVTGFDLIITDIVMPELNGLELLRMLREFVPRPKVIAISGRDVLLDQGYLSVAALFGAAETLQKPVSHLELTAAVRRVLAGPAQPEPLA